jgi:beta-ureidopropionase / N-carbamoyl-L-amino-acid hydrolase
MLMLIREGARFSPGCSGSAVWAAQYPICKSYRLADPKSHLTFGDELKRIGYKGGVPANHMLNPLSAHFELHIEQRRLLQDSKKKIGVVTAIQGIRWYRVIIQGERAHAGSTPMDVRADALVVASKIVLFLEEKAKETSAVATVGVLNLDRPSSNTVPGYADFSIDLRHPSEAVLGRLESSLEKYLDELAIKNGKVEYSLERTWRSPAVDLDNNAVASTRYAATNVVGKSCFMDTVSLAGHDSALTATIVPTSMIFVPSKDGISHSPKEFTSEEEW